MANYKMQNANGDHLVRYASRDMRLPKPKQLGLAKKQNETKQINGSTTKDHNAQRIYYIFL